MTPSTELPRDFCVGIGPLHLGVVLVRNLISIETILELITSFKDVTIAKEKIVK